MSSHHLSVPRIDQDAPNFSRSQAWTSSEDEDTKSHYTVRHKGSRTSLYSYRSTRDLSNFIKEVDGRMYSSMSDLYMLPSDHEEWVRLDMLHDCFLLGIGGLYPQADTVCAQLTSDTPNERTILDLGCGNGRWMTEVGTLFPNAAVTGVDLTPCPLKPEGSANCTFELDNADLGLSHFFDQFDFVHARCISLGISDYRRMMEEAVLCLKPGGFMVLAEFEWQIYEEDKETPALELSENSPRGSALQRIFQESRTGAIHNGSGLAHIQDALAEGLWQFPLIEPLTCRTADLWFPIGNHVSVTASSQRAQMAATLMRQNLAALHRGLHRHLKDSGKTTAELESWSQLADAELASTETLRWIRFQYCWGRRQLDLGEPTTPLPITEPVEQIPRLSLPISEQNGSAAAQTPDVHQVLASDLAPYPYLVVYENQSDSLGLK